MWDKAEPREEEEQAGSHGRVRYILPSRITGTLTEDEPKHCKGKELVFIRATINSRELLASCFRCLLAQLNKFDEKFNGD